jgi:Fic family protein
MEVVYVLNRQFFFEMITETFTLLEWFLGCLLRAIQGAEVTLAQVLAKARFWQHWAGVPMNDRQIRLLNKLLDGFDGNLTSSKWAAIAKCSQDTALRDISDLVERGVLKKSDASGRSTRYDLTPVGDR